ncbi:hypothetical protein B0H34DRAFT_70178 [Crassisporium funariophilum]|nr:hypothetical protein B0H34DRAFT_70178 [Crassisporium funariophilum]
MDFPYLDSVKELEAFSEFIKKLKIKKIQDWWDHKYTSRWIIPCILKSQSKIDPQHLHNLPATTNVGEGQHHWTNHQSGIKLPLVEAILTAREIDERVAREVQGTLDTGIKTNSQTNLIHRMARQAQHQSATARKACETTKVQDLAAEIQSKLDEEKENRRNAAARQKELQAQLKALKAGSGKPKTLKKLVPASPTRFLEGSSMAA